eukprot:scaffold104403_cov31-Tisochrysis_lutea.AAC.5
MERRRWIGGEGKERRRGRCEQEGEMASEVAREGRWECESTTGDGEGGPAHGTTEWEEELRLQGNNEGVQHGATFEVHIHM